MKDEGFLSPAGKRFIAIAAVLIIGGLIAYYAFAEEVSLDLEFLEDLGETSTTSTTFDVPEVEIPEIEVPEPTVPDIEVPGIPQSAQQQIKEANRVFKCIEQAQGDPAKISECTAP